MPKPLPHALLWSREHQHYELHMHGQLLQCFRREDEAAWQNWLGEHVAFAFEGQAGRLSVLKEARSRGTGYWYAYRTRARHTHKRYLGRTTNVTFARLEQEAKTLNGVSAAHLAPLQVSHQTSTNRFGTGREEAWTTSSHKAEQEMALLSSKLSHPRLPFSLVERSRLLRELDMVRSYPLTLVSAPSGSGKTTLLSVWMATSSQQQANEGMAQDAPYRKTKQVVAWLSLEPLDNDPIRFWTSCIAALRTCLPEIGQGTLAMLHAQETPPLSTCLLALLNEILESGRDIILLLDDYHVISEQAIVDSMLFFLAHLPTNMHLVLVTRMDPALPLSRFRVRGQMLEIRASDLRFTQEEAASFLTEGMNLPLSEEDVAILSMRTEGWIAGLQLAVLSLRKREDLSSFVRDFGGSHHFVLDYVQQDILARLSRALQDFLLQTSILTSMNAALCHAVTASPSQQACQEMLEEAERANLFIVPLDEQRQWYRYHDLFREVLSVRLQASQPDLVPLLHIRAARCYEAASAWREAIAHALAAADYPLAASLMERAAKPFWQSGEIRTVHTWVLSLPDPVLHDHIRLALDAALRFLNSAHVSTETVHASVQVQVEQVQRRVEALLRSQSERAFSEAEGALLHRRLCLLRALIEARGIVKRSDPGRLRQLIQEIEELPPDEEVIWNLIPLSLTFWLTMTFQQGSEAHLLSRLLSVRQQAMKSGDVLAVIRVMLWLAHVYTQAEQWHLGQQECLEALALLEQTGVHTAMTGYLYLSLFNVYYAWNRLEEASKALSHLLQIGQEWQQVDLLNAGEISSARFSLATGDLQTAQQALKRVEALIEQEGFSNFAAWVSNIRVRCWLAEGNLLAAADWAGQIVLPPNVWDFLRTEEFLLVVRVSLAQQRYTKATEILERWSGHLKPSGKRSTTIKFLILHVITLHSIGKREQAQAVMARLLSMTEPEGDVRVYLDAGEPIKQVLLEATQDAERGASTVVISQTYVSQLLAAFEQNESSMRRDGTLRTQRLDLPSRPQHTEVQQEGAELLSRQEQRVFRLLIAGQTYAEMAEVLTVSPNTIKTQVSSIYRKLGVSRRLLAICRDRAASAR